VKTDFPFVVIPYKNHFVEFHNLIRGRVIYKNKIVNLASGIIEKKNWKDWFSELDFSISTYFVKPKVIHFFYELGFLINEAEEYVIDDETILAIDLEFKNCDQVTLLKTIKKHEIQNLTFTKKEKYIDTFFKGYKELEKGNCYQFNLTFEQRYKFKDKLIVQEFISKLWNDKKNRGAYASATYLPMIDKALVSNSPECLFQIKNNFLSSMPIKGTVLFENQNEFEVKKEQLLNDIKCESELYMISDLIRNDLSRIELPRSVVLKKKEILQVPSILHLYSEVGVELSDNVFLSTVIKKMFPGGSVTGAPKKRVLSILKNLEDRKRGFYCGSTLILYKEMKSASINIRSADIDLKTNQFSYQAGGGITLRSEAEKEFDEMSYKVKSFLDLLTL
jgi:para-aminobenzoate synthetase component 1